MPHTLQNFVVSRTDAPQLPQNRSLGWVVGVRGGARTNNVPQLPQNFSVSATVLPQPGQTDSATGGGADTGRGGGDATGTTTGTVSSLTIAQHLLQNFSPGLIGFPHDRQDLPDTGCTGAVYGAGCGTGGEIIGDTGAGAGITFIEAPHSPQNFISMLITAPHAGQGRVDGGGGGTGISGTTGAASLRVEPQLPQNFSSGAPIVPHDRQTGGCCGGVGISRGSGTGCDASASEAPQCRQNFAFGTLLCPHSGQYTIIISTELLAGIHKIGTVDPIDLAKEQTQKAPCPDFYFYGAGKKVRGR